LPVSEMKAGKNARPTRWLRDRFAHFAESVGLLSKYVITTRNSSGVFTTTCGMAEMSARSLFVQSTADPEEHVLGTASAESSHML